MIYQDNHSNLYYDIATLEQSFGNNYFTVLPGKRGQKLPLKSDDIKRDPA
jgi:hypothetical protein